MKGSAAVQRASEAPSVRLVSADRMLGRVREIFDAVAERAFEIFEHNGRRLGRDLDDWFRAEAELLHPVPVEISEADGSLTVRAEVPGFSEPDLQVSVEPRRLTISGRRESAGERKQGKGISSDWRSDEIFRAVNLPAEVDAGSKAITAVCDRGVLTITLPKVAKARGREIKVTR